MELERDLQRFWESYLPVLEAGSNLDLDRLETPDTWEVKLFEDKISVEIPHQTGKLTLKPDYTRVKSITLSDINYVFCFFPTNYTFLAGFDFLFFRIERTTHFSPLSFFL